MRAIVCTALGIAIMIIARCQVHCLQKKLATAMAQKGGLPLCAKMGAIIDGLGLGVSSGIGSTLVRGVPEATGIRTAALAKTCKVHPEEANADEESLPLARCITKAPACVYEETCADAVGLGVMFMA